VIIVDAVDLIVDIDRERNTVQAFIAHATPEAARMIGFAHRLQYLRKARDDVIELQTIFQRMIMTGVSPLTISIIR